MSQMNKKNLELFAAKDPGQPPKGASPHSREDLRTLLIGILETIVRLPWLGTNAGGIFLNSPERRELELVAQINFPPIITGTCARVPHGSCLCGRVAESRRLMHVNCIDENHDIHYEGMADHGHYVVPIKKEEELIGVLTLYVAHGHSYDESEARALSDFAATISLIIQAYRQRLDKELADLILRNSDHGVVITDDRLSIQWVNRAFEQTTGYSLEEVRGKTPAILKSGRHPKSFYAAMWASIRSRGHWQGEVWNRRKNGEIYPEMLNIIALNNGEGKVVRYAAMFIDLSDIHEAKEKIRRLAYYDKLTGLPNTELFRETLGQMLGEAMVADQGIVVLVLDLDHFHEINENLGRRVGDATLREVAERIRKIGNYEIAARIGADEFVLAAIFPRDAVASAVTRMRAVAYELRHNLSTPFRFELQELSLDCTMGMAVADLSSDTPDTLMQRTMIAVRHARQQQPGTIQLYDEEIGREAELTHHIITRLPRVTESEELYLLYQPKVDREGFLQGAEVLVRWNDRDHGDIPPDRFIPHAEEHGAIIDIGRWVFTTALSRLLMWRDLLPGEGGGPFLAINLSPIQLMVPQMAARFVELCEQFGVPPSQVEIELTETGIMRRSENIGPNLRTLSEAGFHLAIDDFGTGHSSLSRLHQFPLTTLKIDRSFVSNMCLGVSHVAIVQSIIDMAHTLGCKVVAEGIEEMRQYERLKSMGCDLFQGYLFDRPLSEEEFRDRLQHRQGIYPSLTRA